MSSFTVAIEQKADFEEIRELLYRGDYEADKVDWGDLPEAGEEAEITYDRDLSDYQKEEIIELLENAGYPVLRVDGDEVWNL